MFRMTPGHLNVAGAAITVILVAAGVALVAFSETRSDAQRGTPGVDAPVSSPPPSTVSKSLPPTPPVPTGSIQFAEGIQAGHSGPFASSMFAVSNFYRGSVDGQVFLVHAGTSDIGESQADRDAAGLASGEAGVDVFQSANVDGAGVTPVGMFGDGAAVAPFTITNVAGSEISLVDANGTAYEFDLTTESFGS